MSVREGAGYDEVSRSGQELEEGFSRSSERETSTQSLDEEVESYRGEDRGVVSDEDDEGEEERERERVTGIIMTVTRRL